MKRLNRLTATEHSLGASLLSVITTMIYGDMASPLGAQWEMAGHKTIASFVTASPIMLFVSALLFLLPRTGNESRIGFFRFIGRYPLLIPYFVISLTFLGSLISVAKFFGFGQK
jgi:hypothetical protein